MESKKTFNPAEFFKHSSIYALGNIATRVGSFLLLPLYTHYLAVGEYGALELFYVVSSVVSSLLSAGLAHATLRFYYEYKDIRDRNRVVTSCLISTIIYSIPFVAILSFWNEPLAKLVFGDASLAHGFKWVYGILILELLRQIGLAYFRAKEYSTTYVMVCLLQLVIQVACNVYTVGILKTGVIGVLMGNFFSVLAGCLFIMYRVVKECGFGYDGEKMKSIFKYSYPFLLTALFGVAMANMDRIIIRTFFSLTEVGLYALAFKFGTLVQELIVEPYTRSFGAYRFKVMNDEDAHSILIDIFNQFFLILIVGGMGVSLFARNVIRIMTAEAYWQAYKIIPIITLSYVFQGLAYTFQTGLLYKKKTRFLIHMNLISTGVNFFLYIMLIPVFGPLGAALSVLVKSILEASLNYFISNHYCPIPYPIFNTLKIIGIAVAFVAVANFVPPTTLWPSVGLNVVLFLGFPFALYLTGTIKKDEIEHFRLVVLGVWGRLFSRPVGA